MANVSFRIQALACLGVCLAGLIIFLVSYSTAHWLAGSVGYNSVDYGLWRFCILGNCYTYSNSPRAFSFDFAGKGDEWRVTQAFETLALITFILAAIMTLLLVIQVSKSESALKTIKMVAAIASVLTAVFILIAIITFGAKYKSSVSHLGWSYGLQPVAAFLALFHALLVGVLARVDLYT